jgi:hypothetical protein
VVHGLARGEFGDRREDTIGIAGEEEDSVGVVSKGLLLVVGDVVDRIGDTTILSLLGVVKVDLFGDGVDHHILQECIASNGSIDIWLSLLGEADGLGVAASFKVEDTFVVPAVFVVTDQLAAVEGETGESEQVGCTYWGSAESVVLPVPERPKYRAVSPFLPMLAEQCMDMIPLRGSQ